MMSKCISLRATNLSSFCQLCYIVIIIISTRILISYHICIYIYVLLSSQTIIIPCECFPATKTTTKVIPTFDKIIYDI